MGNPMQFLMQMMSGNPQQMVQNAMQQNPQFNALLNQQKQSGMSMEQYVRQQYAQRNIDINPLIDNLRKRGF